MEKDSIVDCDEIWCKVKVWDTYRKRYVWCPVNREEKIVVYCYEEGSGSRDALKNILGDRQIKTLQSDGYNVYMYLEDRLYNTEHLCCLAHARAKFVYVYEQGGDLNAKQMLEYIGWLYGQEDSYRQSGLSAGEIIRQRNFLRTKDVIGRMRSFLNVLTSEGHPPRVESDGEGCQLPEEFLESDIRLLERRLLQHRQYHCGAFHLPSGW